MRNSLRKTRRTENCCFYTKINAINDFNWIPVFLLLKTLQFWHRKIIIKKKTIVFGDILTIYSVSCWGKFLDFFIEKWLYHNIALIQRGFANTDIFAVVEKIYIQNHKLDFFNKYNKFKKLYSTRNIFIFSLISISNWT